MSDRSDKDATQEGLNWISNLWKKVDAWSWWMERSGYGIFAGSLQMLFSNSVTNQSS